MRPRLVLGLALALAGVSGCGGVSRTAAAPEPGPMPANAQWQGVYQGPYHIQLQIQTKGNQATGTWRAVGGREGEFSGTVSGNLLVLDYTERDLASSEARSGRGYFVYRAGKGGADEISGEWGLGSGGARDAWWAIKRSTEPMPTAALLDNDAAGDADDDLEGSGCAIGCDFQDTEVE